MPDFQTPGLVPGAQTPHRETVVVAAQVLAIDACPLPRHAGAQNARDGRALMNIDDCRFRP